MVKESDGEKKRIFADLVALHQSIASEAPKASGDAAPIADDVPSTLTPRKPDSEAIDDNRYELFCEQMPMGVLLAEVTRDRYRHPEMFKPIKVNMAYAHLLGLARVTILEKDLFEVLPGGLEDWAEIVNEVASKGRPASGIAYWDVTDVHLRVTLFLPRRDLLAVVIEDSAKRGPVVGSVVEHESQLDSIMRLTPDLVCRFLPDGTLTYANLAYCEFFKKVRDELAGHCFLDEIVQEDVEFVRSHLSMLNKNQPSVTYQHRFRGEAGIRWVEWTDVALFDDNGTICEYQSCGREVTSTRKQEIESAERAGYMEDLLRYRAQQHNMSASEASEKGGAADVLSSEVEALKAEIAHLKARTITGHLAVCGTCHRVHDEEGHWMLVPMYLESHTAAHVGSEVCPYCRSKAARELERKLKK